MADDHTNVSPQATKPPAPRKRKAGAPGKRKAATTKPKSPVKKRVAAAKQPVAAKPADETTESATIAAQSRALAQTIVTSFTDRLKSAANKRGGYLSIADIDNLSKELDAKKTELEMVFRQTFETYIKARERAAFDHARKFPFDRLIVNTFAVLFAQERVRRDGDAAVTRRVLPGFFIAMDKILGDVLVAEYQQKTRVIVERLSGGKEDTFNWQMLYDDDEADRVTLDALVAFIPYFEDLAKRREWFLPMINGNLDSADDWVMSEAGFINLVATMFSPLKTAIRDFKRRLELERRHGRAEVDRLDDVFEKLGRESGGMI